jgi:hypothetical protein
VEPLLEGDELRTNLAAIEALMKEYEGKILCVQSTTSCFAPRAYDSIV